MDIETQVAYSNKWRTRRRLRTFKIAESKPHITKSGGKWWWISAPRQPELNRQAMQFVKTKNAPVSPMSVGDSLDFGPLEILVFTETL